MSKITHFTEITNCEEKLYYIAVSGFIWRMRVKIFLVKSNYYVSSEFGNGSVLAVARPLEGTEDTKYYLS